MNKLINAVNPRIRGQVNQALSGPHKDKYFYELSMWNMQGTVQCASFVYGPFDVEVTAREHGRVKTDEMIKLFQTFEGAEPTGQYHDLQDGGKLKDDVKFHDEQEKPH